MISIFACVVFNKFFFCFIFYWFKRGFFFFFKCIWNILDEISCLWRKIEENMNSSHRLLSDNKWKYYVPSNIAIGLRVLVQSIQHRKSKVMKFDTISVQIELLVTKITSDRLFGDYAYMSSSIRGGWEKSQRLS